MVMHSVLLKSILIGILLVVSVIPLHAASDLVVTTVASPPASLTTGAKFSLPTTVTNQGTAASPKTTITYYLSPGSSKDNAWLLSSKRSVKELAPGATYTAKAKVTVPSGIPSDTYHLLACIDDTNQASEDNEDNNCTSSPALVDLVVPDLTITDISDLPPAAALKTSLSITASVKNTGTYPSGPSRTYYYWSPDTTISPTLKPIKQSVQPLDPQVTSTTLFSLKTPKIPGAYYLIACADGANKVKEEDETNNCITSPTTIIVGLPAISFSSTTDTQKFNSLPPGTTTIRVTFDGVTRVAPASAATLITFASPDGDHTYTAQALSGTTILASLGPITIKTFSSFPLTIPLAFSFPSFDTYQTDIGLNTPNTLIYIGTPGPNRIVQYGGGAADLLSVSTGEGNDWIEQYGGGGVDNFLVDSGTGNDHVYQEGGAGSNKMYVQSADGDDWIIQVGGDGNDEMKCDASDGNDNVYQEGGAGNDDIGVNGGFGNDTVFIDAGPGDDTITYDVSPGTDTASIDGGTGTDALTVNNPDELPLLIQHSGLNVIYQSGIGGTTITVIGIEQITVNDAGGNPIFTWP
jgi:hypothetical protein